MLNSKDVNTFNDTKNYYSLFNFLNSLLFWKGRKKGMIHTKDICLDDIRSVFMPKDFYEKYRYLGSVPYRETSDLFNTMYPLVLAMDHEAKPKWCPRWVLRFLYLFGSDNSIVRVRNKVLHNLQTKLTKGILIWDYKTKWSNYDLRISISAPYHLHDLASYIERGFYLKGLENELVNKILAIDPSIKVTRGNIEVLKKQLDNIQASNE